MAELHNIFDNEKLIHFRYCINYVCNLEGVDDKDFSRRFSYIVTAKRLLSFIGRDICKLSYSRIGTELKLDHSSIIHQYKSHSELVSIVNGKPIDKIYYAKAEYLRKVLDISTLNSKLEYIESQIRSLESQRQNILNSIEEKNLIEASGYPEEIKKHY